MRGGKGLWPWLVALTVTAVVLVLGAVTFAPLTGEDGLQISANRAQLTGGFLIAAAVPVIAVLTWAGRRSRELRTRAVPTAERLARAVGVLADLVAEQWKDEARLRSLDDPDPIPVRWHTPDTAGVMDHPANVEPAGSPGTWTASSADIGALADRFRRTRRRRLVILGGPGTGKTTLAMQLLLHLLATRTPDEPVPVLLPVAGWDTEEHPRLQSWLADRLSRDYPALRSPELGADVTQALTARGHVLPVLDGLDELPASAQANVITALNRSLGGDDQLILTSRTTEFTDAVTEAGDVITSAAVLEPRPLDPAAAADYLFHCLPPSPGPVWQQILTDLRALDRTGSGSTALAGVAATPLGLWLLRTVYAAPGADPSPLADPARFPSPEALRAHLFDRLIDALISTREPTANPAEPFRPRHRHDPAETRHWLGYLAHHLTSRPTTTEGSQGARDFAWWRLAATSRAITRHNQLTMAFIVSLALGLVLFVITGEPVLGLLFGPTVGIALGISAESWAHDLPGYADLRIRRRSAELVRDLISGLVYGLVVGLTETLIVALTDGLTKGLTNGLTNGLPIGLVVGFTLTSTGWAESSAQVHHATTPLRMWRADRSLTLLRVSTFGLMSGLAAGLVFDAASGLTLGLMGGLTLGLIGGNHRAWPAYLFATVLLARAGLVPRRLMPFLDDCHRLGLLRAVGPIYQFRHAELQDHLAATYRPTP